MRDFSSVPQFLLDAQYVNYIDMNTNNIYYSMILIF